ncbi:hypothetical protein [Streptomyces sp. M92]|uniref:hypothetical protein n=1 Tax=Streptomyces sp. M92 TaxID=2944250 RepID=UPI00234B139B|nr:hypothetical protein [Streptomyces sp. M92]WCN05420.1 hypothetical protein M6G08_26915 [Streptomyces sp. M92]
MAHRCRSRNWPGCTGRRPGQACDAVEGALRHLERTGGRVSSTEVAPTAVEALCGGGRAERAHRIVADFDAGTAGATRPPPARPSYGALAARLGGTSCPTRKPAEQDGAGRRQTAVDTIHAVIEQYQIPGALGRRPVSPAAAPPRRRHHAPPRPSRPRRPALPCEQEVTGLVVQGRANRERAESRVRLATAVPAPRPYESRWPRARMRLMSMT